MDKRTRAYKLYKAGLEEFGPASESQDAFLRAIAVMIDNATKKRKTNEIKIPGYVGEFAGELIKHAGDSVIHEPYDVSWDKQLFMKLNSIKGKYTAYDASLVGDYLAAGNWVGTKPSLGTVIRYLPELIAKAREQQSEMFNNDRYA